MSQDIALTPVTTSSNVTGIGYDPLTRTLAVRFRTGATYHYADVRAEDYEACMKATSVGGFVARHIVREYHGVRVDATVAAQVVEP